MKTARSLIKQEDSISYGYNYENKTAIDSKIVKDLMIAYAREAIKADRENVVKHAKLYDEGFWVEGECYPNYKLDENSILNAPQIELL